MDHFSKSAMISKMNNLLELLLKITRSNEPSELFEKSLSQFKWIVNFDYCQYVYFNTAKQMYCFETISYGIKTGVTYCYHSAGEDFEKELGALFNNRQLLQTELNNLPLLNGLLSWLDLGVYCLFSISVAKKNEKTSALLFLSKDDVFGKDDKVLMTIFANLMLLNISSIKDLQDKEQKLEYQQEIIDETSTDLAIRVQELALANKYKSQFLANMSHELRSPLNSILLLTKALIKNTKHHLDDTEIEDLRVILEGGEGLQSLIHNIMDLSKVEAGKITLHVEPIKISQLASHLHKIFAPLASDKGLSFSIALDKNLPEEIVSDESRLAQVLRNLLFNAIKFTPQGSVSLSISISEPGAKFSQKLSQFDSSITFAVTDTGIGIPNYKQQAIFESFQQVDGSDSRHYGGTGLGLTICRGLTHLLGGDIVVHSNHGSGSTFSIHLPMNFNAMYHIHSARGLTNNEVVMASHFGDQSRNADQQNVSADKDNAESADQADQGLLQQLKNTYQPLIANKILLIDTDMRACFALSKKLINFGFEVDFSLSVDEAVDIYPNHSYQLLLIEPELIRVKQQPAAVMISLLLDTQKSFIITMNNGSCIDGSNMQTTEIHGQLNKPIDIEKLLALMQQLFIT